MIDCGLFQERQFAHRNWEPCPVAASQIKALLLTHVHIDHSGLIPKFVREGYRGKVYATHATVDLAEIVLRDSAQIHEEDAKYKKRRHQREGRQGKHPEIPLYTVADADRSLQAFRGLDYGQRLEIAEGLQVVFHDAGHVLGSAILEIIATENQKQRRILFSGDLGQSGKPLIRDPTDFDQADYVVIESTYGDRDHDQSGDVKSQLKEIINSTVQRGGNVVIPTFAVERAQEVMYHISQLVYEDQIPDIPIYLDSPMAVDVTEVFRRHRDDLDEETWKLIASDEPPLQFPGLQLVQSVEDSRKINLVQKPCIIMSPAGMCTAGRIKHHLRLNLSRPECTVVFVGYQAHGTLGRQISDGHQEVRLHGAMRKVRARITQIQGLSAHADRQGLLRWIGHLKQPPRRVFVTHGEPAAATRLAQDIQQTLKFPTTIPAYGDTAELA
jgi:metallo-beta-lactamase family protein